jgi:hypothetical protein
MWGNEEIDGNRSVHCIHELTSKNVKSIACGGYHCMVLTGNCKYLIEGRERGSIFFVHKLIVNFNFLFF